MEVMLNGRPNSGRAPLADAVQAIRIAETSGQQPMLVTYYPVANTNPYQALMYSRFPACGIGVLPLHNRDDAITVTTLSDLDVPVALHLHWTAWVLDGATDPAAADRRIDGATEWLAGLGRAGMRLIWTVHNVLPHDVEFVEAQVRLQRWLAANADVVHVLSRNTPEVMKDIVTFPPEKLVHVAHPNYRGAYAEHLTREQARWMLGLDPDEVVYVLPGAIKAYKGLDRLIPAIQGLDSTPPRRLLVAGKPDAHPESVRFVADCRRHAQVIIDGRRIPDGEMQVYLRAADLALLPYRRTLNSGAAMLALSFGLPVVAPAVGALAETLSAECAELFDPAGAGAFEAALRRADRLLTPRARRAASVLAQRYDADTLSRALATELRRRLAGPASSVGEWCE